MDTAEQRLAEAIGRELSRRYNHPMIGHSCVCNDTGLCGLHASQGRIAVEVVKGQENPGFWLPDVLVEARQERDQARADAEQLRAERDELDALIEQLLEATKLLRQTVEATMPDGVTRTTPHDGVVRGVGRDALATTDRPEYR